MNIFKKKSLCAALAGIGALGAVGAAQAVNLNPDGLGQVLIYPYYTTRADAAGNIYNSLLSVVNTTASVKAVKVRFLEGKNSREVLDFNLFLSPKDVWTAAITPSGAGGAMIQTDDTSCTLPAIPAAGKAFVNFAYASDGAGSSLDRTQEGYVEIIEMGAVYDGSTTAVNVTHVNGVPPGCAAVTDAQASNDTTTPLGGLMGGMTLINVDSGTDYTSEAVALDNYSDTSLYANSGSTLPDLQEASPPVSGVISGGYYFESFWAGANADPVSAVLMHDQVMNEFVLDSITNSGTDWVVTMPTKRFYVQNGTGAAAGGLFQRNFNKTDGSCDDVSLNIYDREENTTSTPLDFSPPPPTQTNSVCWEANVITFNNSNVLGSANSANIPTSYEHGWLNLGFGASGYDGITGDGTATVAAPLHQLISTNTTVQPLGSAATTGLTVTYNGLPVVGFAVQSFANGAIQVGGEAVLSNYGGNFVQKGTTYIN
jgi:hypothetical protein